MHDLGQETPPLGAGLTDDRKALCVAGEGVWKVADLGAITFTPAAPLQGVPSPVDFQKTVVNAPAKALAQQDHDRSGWFAGRYWRLALMAAVLGRELGRLKK